MPVEPSVGIKYATISVAADQTDTILVTGVTGKRIRVIAYHLTAGAACTMLIESGTTTALTGTMDLTANGDLSVSYAGGVMAPAFETVIGENLVLTNVGAGGNIEGWLAYQEV